MAGRLDGKVALVTGGGTGIGAATARRFAEEGATVIVCGRRIEPLEQVVHAIQADGGAARAVLLDVSDRQAFADVVTGIERQDGRLEEIDAGVDQVGKDLARRGLFDETADAADRLGRMRAIQILIEVAEQLHVLDAQRPHGRAQFRLADAAHRVGSGVHRRRGVAPAFAAPNRSRSWRAVAEMASCSTGLVTTVKGRSARRACSKARSSVRVITQCSFGSKVLRRSR